MKKLKTLTFAVVVALSLVASGSDAFAKDARQGRETAWTDLGPVPQPREEVFEVLGVTWEE